MVRKHKLKLKRKKPVIYAFIDSQNLNLGVANDVLSQRNHKLIYTGWKLDYAKFRTYLTDKYHVDQAYLFIGFVEGNEALYTFLQKSGYTCIFKPTLEYHHGKKTVIKGNVDAELVLHTMIECNNFTQAIIVAGDGDYYCLVEHLEKIHKLKKVMIPNRFKYSSLLRRFRQYFVYVSDLRNKLALKKRGSSLRTKP